MPNKLNPTVMLKEPLVLFLVLGALIFALDSYLAPDVAQATEGAVVVSAQQVAGFKADFAEREGRPPTDAELQSYIDNWIEREVLYRQALALGLDKNDRLIRRQLVRKMRYLLEDAHPLPEPSEAALRDWLRAHPERYGQPPTVSFDHVFIDRGNVDGERRAAALLARLRGGAAKAGDGGDAFPGAKTERRADPTDLAKDFGKDFWSKLEELEPGQWQGPIRTNLGLHLVRVIERTPFVPATLESAGKKLRADYRNYRRERANARAIEDLRARFDVDVQQASG